MCIEGEGRGAKTTMCLVPNSHVLYVHMYKSRRVNMRDLMTPGNTISTH